MDRRSSACASKATSALRRFGTEPNVRGPWPIATARLRLPHRLLRTEQQLDLRHLRMGQLVLFQFCEILKDELLP